MDTKRVQELVALLASGGGGDSVRNDASSELRRVLDESLDAAWAEAEGALPEGWAFQVKRDGDRCEAMAFDNWGEAQLLTTGSTPAAALRGLVLNLREVRR